MEEKHDHIFPTVPIPEEDTQQRGLTKVNRGHKRNRTFTMGGQFKAFRLPRSTTKLHVRNIQKQNHEYCLKLYFII